ncbi:hypothetical protein MIMGU_mgv1a021317mg [Erythranthe guttata]|uniref:Uncharacterized protein n=1 Tax=Erythranthe guttata TaxID=4155 RepID=A0A022RR47_ERYGU|nr:PREDICTED: uncharacterized protein LOC105953400 [Erythranthe guttata]EYU41410.1 hypothetical protein MIMGU_mgv1a021317mg [Erythranthe guttata]|eukprot:XP_012832514.1 PREDICTED: uncharacterized protein LOC105953400 [Erythranthe guttata]
MKEDTDLRKELSDVVSSISTNLSVCIAISMAATNLAKGHKESSHFYYAYLALISLAIILSFLYSAAYKRVDRKEMEKRGRNINRRKLLLQDMAKIIRLQLQPLGTTEPLYWNCLERVNHVISTLDETEHRKLNGWWYLPSCMPQIIFIISTAGLVCLALSSTKAPNESTLAPAPALAPAPSG